MSTEAHRLMMVSLGKIQGCRQQRGGINLHKSLLVTKVLHKARNIAIYETSPRKVEETKDQTVPEVVMKEQDCQTSPEPVLPHDGETSDSASAGKPQTELTLVTYDREGDNQNKENTCPVDNVPSNDSICDQGDVSASPKKDNDSCSRCVKRRLTEVEAAVESITPKKQRLESESEEQQQQYQCSQQEAMQVETTQISNLVNRFSSGFTGLLATEDSSDGQSDSSEVQGHSTSQDSLHMCSTQMIKESFELLARPIALSV